MAVTFLDAIDFTKIPSLQFVIPMVAADPAGYEAGFIYNTTTKEIKYYNGTAWVALGPAGAGGPPTGAAGGDLSGSYPNPQIAAGVIVHGDVAAANIDGAAATPSMRTLGTGANQAAPGNDSRFTDSRPPTGNAGGDLSGTYPNPQIATGVIVDADVATSNKDGVAATPSMRTLGFGAQQALSGTTRLDQIAVPTAAVSLNAQKITNLADPTANTDAANKQYVDNLSAGLSWKDAVRAASTVNGTLSSAFANGSVIDGVTLATGNRILIKNQTTTTENGIYTVNASGAPTRATDADSGTELEQACVFIMEGTTLADTAWVCTTNSPITIGSTGLTFAQFGGGASYTGGTGILQTGNDFSLSNPDGTLTLAADTVAVASAPKWTTTRTISLTGAVTGGPANIDGTGNVSIATTQATVKGYNQDIGGATSIAVTHNLNTTDVGVILKVKSTGAAVMAGWTATSVNVVTITFATAPAASSIRCSVLAAA